ncbi:MAG: ISAzo13-like element transposase-related protein, partial [Desulfuromonadaceae bacterium]
LEKSWNGYLLDSVDTVMRRAGNFFWKGMRTITRLLDGVYEKGVKVCGDEKTELEQRLQRSPVLNWWDITIQPKTVNL